MANPALSNRDRKRLKKAIPTAPRRLKGEALVKVAAADKKPVERKERDGLVWLTEKRRLTPVKAREAMRYRTGYRDAGEVAVRSSLNIGVPTTAPSMGSDCAPAAMSEARAEMLVIKYEVLRGHDDMITVMDGVCGLGHTLRFLAGGNRHRADELEIALNIALDLIIGWRMSLTQSAA